MPVQPAPASPPVLGSGGGRRATTTMLCTKCHQKEATVHFKAVVDGTEEETVRLCKDCAPDTDGKYSGLAITKHSPATTPADVVCSGIDVRRQPKKRAGRVGARS